MKVVSIGRARELGLHTYFTGAPCKRGHVGERYTKKRSCTICVREDSLKRSRTEKVRAQNKDNKKKESYRLQQKDYKSTDRYKESARALQKKYRELNPEKFKQKEKDSRLRRAEKITAYNKLYYYKNTEYFSVKTKIFSTENPWYFLGKNAERRAAIRRAVPSWYSDIDQFIITEAYELARKRAEVTGFNWDVDHRIPLACRTASGLHCADNVQVIPSYANRSKSNKMIFVEDFEWLKAA